MTEEKENMAVQVFEHSEFGNIRTVNVNSQPYFVGKDIASALGYVDTDDAIRRHCKGVVKHRVGLNTGAMRLDGTFATQTFEMNIIPESDIYRLIMRSQLESAERFQDWVCEEVLPSIRKHGGYFAGQEKMTDIELLARAVLTSQSIIAEKEKQLQEAIKTKAYISDRKTATALQNSGVKTKIINRLEKEKEVLSVEKEELQTKLGEVTSYATVTAVQRFMKNVEVSYSDLKASCKRLGLKIVKVAGELPLSFRVEAS